MIGETGKPRPPFQMVGARGAQARYVTHSKATGKERKVEVVRSGRASFVWLWYVLMPLACGSTESVEIRLDWGRAGRPWHTVTGSDDAYRQIMDREVGRQDTYARNRILVWRAALRLAGAAPCSLAVSAG